MSITRRIAGTAIACALVVALPARPARGADESINEDARKHFAAGVALLQDPDGARYEDAYREFEAAYASSHSPKILGNIGYCALKLERDGEAIAAYTRYLQEVPDIDPAESAQINRDVATLRAGLVRVTVTVDAPDATVTDRRIPVRGDPINNLYGPPAAGSASLEMGIRPGHHIVEAKVRGESLEPWEFDAKPGEALSHAFARKVVVADVRPTSSTGRTVSWVVMGIGAASLAAGGVVGAITLGKVNTIANNCPNNSCPSTYALKPAQDDVHRFVTVTDTLLIGGGVLTAAGLYLFFSSGSSAPRAPSSAARTALSAPTLGCSTSGCMAALQGSF